MVNIEHIKDVIKPYLLTFEDEAFSFIKKEYDTIGIEETFNKYIKLIDCTRYTKDGKFRLVQTIDFMYHKTITEIVWFLDNIVDEDSKLDLYKKLIEVHNSNIEFEVNHLNVWYTSKKYTKKDYQNNYDNNGKTKAKRVRKSKDPVITGLDKETAAERKLKAKVAKIDKLNFKVKPT